MSAAEAEVTAIAILFLALVLIAGFVWLGTKLHHIHGTLKEISYLQNRTEQAAAKAAREREDG